MKKLLLSLVAIGVMTLANAQENDANKIMKQVKYQSIVPDEYMEMTMELVNERGKKKERFIKQYIFRSEGLRKSLIIFTDPSDIRGSGFLSIENKDRDDDNWLYLPALRRSRRISPSDLTDKFMGSDFTFEDLEDEDISQFKYKYLGEKKINDRPCHIIEAVPFLEKKISETGYSKRIIHVDKASSIMSKIDYYDLNGEHIKTYEAGGLTKLENSDKWRSYEMSMSDLKKKHSTKLNYNIIKLNNGLEPEFFSKRSLETGI